MKDDMIAAQVRRAQVRKITSKPDGSFLVRWVGFRGEPRRTTTRDLESTLFQLSLRPQAN